MTRHEYWFLLEEEFLKHLKENSMEHKLSGKKILEGIDFTKIDDCYVECKDGTFHLVVKHNSGTTQYFLGFKTILTIKN